jgi:hypothetical protein
MPRPSSGWLPSPEASLQRNAYGVNLEKPGHLELGRRNGDKKMPPKKRRRDSPSVEKSAEAMNPVDRPLVISTFKNTSSGERDAAACAEFASLFQLPGEHSPKSILDVELNDILTRLDSGSRRPVNAILKAAFKNKDYGPSSITHTTGNGITVPSNDLDGIVPTTILQSAATFTVQRNTTDAEKVIISPNDNNGTPQDAEKIQLTLWKRLASHMALDRRLQDGTREYIQGLVANEQRTVAEAPVIAAPETESWPQGDQINPQFVIEHLPSFKTQIVNFRKPLKQANHEIGDAVGMSKSSMHLASSGQISDALATEMVTKVTAPGYKPPTETGLYAAVRELVMSFRETVTEKQLQGSQAKAYLTASEVESLSAAKSLGISSFRQTLNMELKTAKLSEPKTLHELKKIIGSKEPKSVFKDKVIFDFWKKNSFVTLGAESENNLEQEVFEELHKSYPHHKGDFTLQCHRASINKTDLENLKAPRFVQSDENYQELPMPLANKAKPLFKFPNGSWIAGVNNYRVYWEGFEPLTDERYNTWYSKQKKNYAKDIHSNALKTFFAFAKSVDYARMEHEENIENSGEEQGERTTRQSPPAGGISPPINAQGIFAADPSSDVAGLFFPNERTYKVTAFSGPPSDATMATYTYPAKDLRRYFSGFLTGKNTVRVNHEDLKSKIDLSRVEEYSQSAQLGDSVGFGGDLDTEMLDVGSQSSSLKRRADEISGTGSLAGRFTHALEFGDSASVVSERNDFKDDIKRLVKDKNLIKPRAGIQKILFDPTYNTQTRQVLRDYIDTNNVEALTAWSESLPDANELPDERAKGENPEFPQLRREIGEQRDLANQARRVVSRQNEKHLKQEIAVDFVDAVHKDPKIAQHMQPAINFINDVKKQDGAEHEQGIDYYNTLNIAWKLAQAKIQTSEQVTSRDENQEDYSHYEKDRITQDIIGLHQGTTMARTNLEIYIKVDSESENIKNAVESIIEENERRGNEVLKTFAGFVESTSKIFEALPSERALKIATRLRALHQRIDESTSSFEIAEADRSSSLPGTPIQAPASIASPAISRPHDTAPTEQGSLRPLDQSPHPTSTERQSTAAEKASDGRRTRRDVRGKAPTSERGGRRR